MPKNKKQEESSEEIKSRLREELSDLYDRYGFDLVKSIVNEDVTDTILLKLIEKSKS